MALGTRGARYLIRDGNSERKWVVDDTQVMAKRDLLMKNLADSAVVEKKVLTEASNKFVVRNTSFAACLKRSCFLTHCQFFGNVLRTVSDVRLSTIRRLTASILSPTNEICIL